MNRIALLMAYTSLMPWSAMAEDAAKLDIVVLTAKAAAPSTLKPASQENIIVYKGSDRAVEATLWAPPAK